MMMMMMMMMIQIRLVSMIIIYDVSNNDNDDINNMIMTWYDGNGGDDGNGEDQIKNRFAVFPCHEGFLQGTLNSGTPFHKHPRLFMCFKEFWNGSGMGIYAP